VENQEMEVAGAENQVMEVAGSENQEMEVAGSENQEMEAKLEVLEPKHCQICKNHYKTNTGLFRHMLTHVPASVLSDLPPGGDTAWCPHCPGPIQATQVELHLGTKHSDGLKNTANEPDGIMITLKCRESEESDFDMSILECVPTNPEQAPADPANAQSDPETNSADRRLNPEVLDTEIPSHELEDTEEHSPEGEEKETDVLVAALSDQIENDRSELSGCKPCTVRIRKLKKLTLDAFMHQLDLENDPEP